MATLLLIDGTAILRHIYEIGISSTVTASSHVDVALNSTLALFRKLVDIHTPTHVLAVVDLDGPTFRQSLSASYQRKTATYPEALKDALPRFHKLVRDAGMMTVSVPNAESIDVIATAAQRWLKEGRGEVVIASNDKTHLALVSQGARIWDPIRREWHGNEWIEQRYGVPAESVIELLALMGDKHHGIPGVTKIGIKTAAKLLRSYHSFEGVMAGAGILKDTLGERLRKERDEAYLSLALVQPKADVQIGITWKAVAYPSAQLSE
ncbi:5'-3' exonuclease [Noviherbaspirillum sp. Root189]|uniref:5'-3' exonuclease n=1 Tax=Noviherbaspirillum sp. Root189 TaxID=1736487 RepID=UPI00070B59F0|nr:5'-3' exonuclease H3TH domain-containing protein [Noviherbaspirillum sp. Root189]KRB72540.1 hypothetical protein ASE07_27075 [Noviherbaspirillum sp. Root189]